MAKRLDTRTEDPNTHVISHAHADIVPGTVYLSPEGIVVEC